jgi:hypothetical protein
VLGHCCVGILNGRPYEGTGILFRPIATRIVDVDKHHSGYEPIDQVVANIQAFADDVARVVSLTGTCADCVIIHYSTVIVIVIYAQSR